jgi:3'-phosphoadenosine 5'-phosphosulfate sulfotransferase (PAPS reductase)/FAD synthetase
VKHLVSLSGGMTSAIAAQRVIDRYGLDAVTLWFADTRWEDEDLYRFLSDLERRWGLTIVRRSQEETPLQVAERRKMIPNSLVAACPFELKINPFEAYLRSVPKPITVHLGIAWWEQHRTAKPKARYESFDGVVVDFPLLWTPLNYRPPEDVIREWGITPPRLYAMGFSHNNCAGRCVKQGIREWVRLLVHFPERFAQMEAWEAAQRAKGGKRANRTICTDRVGGTRKPLTLAAIRERYQDQRGNDLLLLGQPDEAENCLCSVAGA